MCWLQSQVEEYKQLKDTLNKIPSFRHSEKLEPNKQLEVRAPSPHSDLPEHHKAAAELHKEV